uniref:Uncharacterized protein n=1 Tax=Arundo donax TaxID=35708 RepID=A0A0A9PU16_ARUDO
MAESNFARTQP